MRNFKTWLIAGAAALALVVGFAAPSGAQSAAVGAFVGSASVNPGLYYPINPTNANCTPTCPSGSGGTWNFSGSGAGISVNPNGGPTFATAAGGTLNDGATGLGAFCGASGGSNGTGNVSLSGPIGNVNGSLTNVGWLQSVGSLIIFTGDISVGSESGAIVGVVSALPLNIPAESCLSGTARNFTVVGAAAAAIA